MFESFYRDDLKACAMLMIAPLTEGELVALISTLIERPGATLPITRNAVRRLA